MTKNVRHTLKKWQEIDIMVMVGKRGFTSGGFITQRNELAKCKIAGVALKRPKGIH